MIPLRLAALAALMAIGSPAAAFADGGVIAGCPYGQSFAAGPITVTGAFVPAPPRGAPTAAAYMTIANAGAADTLTGASSAAGSLTLHQVTANGSVMQMAEVTGGLAVPASGAVRLDPMGYHLMLTGMSAAFAPGQCVEMTLHFAHAGDLPITLNVAGLGQTSAPSGPPSGGSAMPSGSSAMDMGGMPGMSSAPM